MSAIVHAAQTVAATPLPSPQVVKEVFTNSVPVQVPADVLQLGQVLGLALATGFVSLVHQLVERGRLSGNINRLIVAAYTLLAALATALLSGHLGTSINDLQVEITALLVALGAALSRYEFLWKAVVQILANVMPQAPNPPKDTPAAEPAIEGQG